MQNKDNVLHVFEDNEWKEVSCDFSYLLNTKIQAPVFKNNKIIMKAGEDYDGNLAVGEALEKIMQCLRVMRITPKSITVYPIDYMVLDYADLSATSYVIADIEGCLPVYYNDKSNYPNAVIANDALGIVGSKENIYG